ncbi:hypothetical protein GCM10023176_57040 [Micromonospora coerulea]|uniref:N-acetyltransferase domain-containing protein n=1 Tax=Micromonospora coerulea TaxID=47856 RepID=A0ABP8T0Z0_9ACTN
MAVAVDLVGELAPEPELSSRPRALARDELERMASCAAYRLLVGRVDGEIRGTLTLVVYPLLAEVRARIDDVVVERSATGVAVASALVRQATALAREAGARRLKLTSRPSLVEVNRRYGELRFDDCGSSVYHLVFEPRDDESAGP